jgi:hypothetical protein
MAVGNNGDIGHLGCRADCGLWGRRTGRGSRAHGAAGAGRCADSRTVANAGPHAGADPGAHCASRAWANSNPGARADGNPYAGASGHAGADGHSRARADGNPDACANDRSGDQRIAAQQPAAPHLYRHGPTQRRARPGGNRHIGNGWHFPGWLRLGDVCRRYVWGSLGPLPGPDGDVHGRNGPGQPVGGPHHGWREHSANPYRLQVVTGMVGLLMGPAGQPESAG